MLRKTERALLTLLVTYSQSELFFEERKVYFQGSFRYGKFCAVMLRIRAQLDLLIMKTKV